MGKGINGKKVVVNRGGTIKGERLINVTRCCVAGSDVSVERAGNLPDQNLYGKNYPTFQELSCWDENVGRFLPVVIEHRDSLHWVSLWF